MVAGSVDAAADDLQSLRFDPRRSSPGPWFPGRGQFRTARGRRSASEADFVEMLDDDAIEVGEEDLDGALAGVPRLPDEDAAPFRLDDDFFLGMEAGAAQPADAVPPVGEGSGPADWTAAFPDLSGPAFALSGEEPDGAAAPIIDRYEEVPERFWAPEIAGLGRRALALLVDLSLLALVLGAFFVGAWTALQLSGADAGQLLGAGGLQASALPFALLGAGLSLAGSLFFHGTAGRTPGKALLGIEVRSADGGPLTWGRVCRRWLGAVLGLGCAGIGVAWALFEPRHRGWADLISGTVVARPRQQPAAGPADL
jgi:uncharacterized RDD family membrane protein YckC